MRRDLLGRLRDAGAVAHAAYGTCERRENQSRWATREAPLGASPVSQARVLSACDDYVADACVATMSICSVTSSSTDTKPPILGAVMLKSAYRNVIVASAVMMFPSRPAFKIGRAAG